MTVKREGRHLSVRTPAGDELYRVTLQPDGHWVSCDRYGNGIGDNIALVMDLEPGSSFHDAVYRLSGGGPISPIEVPTYTPPKPPRLAKPKPVDIDAGRQYLAGRGIDLETIEHAESCGMVQYMSGSVVFCGYDAAGKLRSATRRATNPADEVQRRDLKGTDKGYAGVLPGNPESVWVVEGGVDALALHAMARRRGKQPPTIIVSGGSNVLSIFDNERVQAVLGAATQVHIAAEIEKDPETQVKTDAARAKQAQRVQELTGQAPAVWVPPEGKDLAEYNQARLEALRQAQDLAAEVVADAGISRVFKFSVPK